MSLLMALNIDIESKPPGIRRYNTQNKISIAIFSKFRIRCYVTGGVAISTFIQTDWLEYYD